MEARKVQGFFALAILLVVAPVVLCQDPDGTGSASGTELVTRAVRSGPDDPDNTVYCAADGNVCYNCTAAPLCIKTGTTYINRGPAICADLNANKPHCNKGVCSDTPDEDKCKSSSGSETDFLCTADGYLPDPDDCQKFYFCVNGKGTGYACSDGYVYSHEKAACIKKKVSSDCAVIKCKYTNSVEFVVYPKDPSVYGLCIRGETTVVLTCEYPGYEFDTKISDCAFVCKKEGLFAVGGSKTDYIECVKTGSNKYTAESRECPDGSEFSSEKGKCAVITPAGP